MKKVLIILLSILLVAESGTAVFAEGGDIKYTITINDEIKNGTVTIYGGTASVAAGENIELEVISASGYELNSISYKEEGEDSLNNIYYNHFVMPEANVTICATFIEKNYDQATGVFGEDYSREINTIAKYLNISAKELENNIQDWIKNNNSSNLNDLFDIKSKQDMYMKIALLMMYLDCCEEEENLKQNPIDITKCKLNTDVLYKALARIIEASEYTNSISSVMTSESSSIINELDKCLGTEGGTCSLNPLIKKLNEAQEVPSSSTLLSAREKLIKTIKNYYGYNLDDEMLENLLNYYNVTSLDDIDFDYIQNGLDFAAYYKDNGIAKAFIELITNGDNSYETIEKIKQEFHYLPVLNSLLPSEFTMHDYDLMDKLVDSESGRAVGLLKGLLNSDVLFKSKAKKIEAIQTKNSIIIINTDVSLFQSTLDENKYVLGLEDEESLIDLMLIKFFGYERYEIKNDTSGYIEVGVYGNDSVSGAINGSKIILKPIAKDGKEVDKVYYDYGEGKIEVTDFDSNGNYYFTMPSKDVTITADIIEPQLRAPKTTTFQYDGKVHTGAATISSNVPISYKTKTSLEASYEEIAGVPEISDIGELYVIASTSGTGSTSGQEIAYTLKVIPHNLYITIVGKTFGEEDDDEVAYIVETNSLLQGETPSFSGIITRERGENAGDYDVSLNNFKLLSNGSFNADNYKLKLSKEKYTISPKTIKGASLSVIPNKDYNGTAITPSLTVKDGATILVEGTDYVLTYENNVNIGTAKVIISGVGNYKDSLVTTFEIVRAKTNAYQIVKTCVN